jgi:hypothetical protein
MWHRVSPGKIDVSEERIVYIMSFTRIGGLGTTFAVTGNRSTLRRNSIVTFVPSSPVLTLMMEVIHSSETSVLTRTIRCNSPECCILRASPLTFRRNRPPSYSLSLYYSFLDPEHGSDLSLRNVGPYTSFTTLNPNAVLLRAWDVGVSSTPAFLVQLLQLWRLKTDTHLSVPHCKRRCYVTLHNSRP